MNLTMQAGFPDYVGKRFIWNASGTGSKTYTAAAGDPVALPGYNQYIDNIFPAVTKSGTYFVVAVPSNVGPRATWTLYWYTLTDMQPITGPTDLSGESVQLSGFGGMY